MNSALMLLLIGWILMGGLGYFADLELITRMGIFILAIFCGYMVIWNVTPSLHTPLMAVTNAISGIIVVGCMESMAHKEEETEFLTDYSITAIIGLFFASINIFGGFLVTKRMLQMFHK